jgi:hypothetical protein
MRWRGRCSGLLSSFVVVAMQLRTLSWWPCDMTSRCCAGRSFIRGWNPGSNAVGSAIADASTAVAAEQDRQPGDAQPPAALIGELRSSRAPQAAASNDDPPAVNGSSRVDMASLTASLTPAPTACSLIKSPSRIAVGRTGCAHLPAAPEQLICAGPVPSSTALQPHVSTDTVHIAGRLQKVRTAA